MELDVARILRHTFVAVVELHEAIGSTNDRAISYAAEPPVPLPLLILAERQTAGRGRGGNRWWTGDGALACSLLLGWQSKPSARGAPVSLAFPAPPLVSLAAALAVVEAVRPLLGDRIVGIHWPNDVIVGRGKLAGILVEAVGGKLVIGIGVNTNNRLCEAPAEIQDVATTLFDLTGRFHSHTEILVALLNSLHRLLEELPRRPAYIAAMADRACLQRGQNLSAQLGSERIVGRCGGIASDGALILETLEGTRRLYSGVLLRQ